MVRHSGTNGGHNRENPVDYRVFSRDIIATKVPQLLTVDILSHPLPFPTFSPARAHSPYTIYHSPPTLPYALGLYKRLGSLFVRSVY